MHSNPFFVVEEEPCINAQVVRAGAYFGQDVQVIIDRLLGEQLSDDRILLAFCQFVLRRLSVSGHTITLGGTNHHQGLSRIAPAHQCRERT